MRLCIYELLKFIAKFMEKKICYIQIVVQKINILRNFTGQKFVPLYTLQIDTKKKSKKTDVKVKNWTVLWQTYIRNNI